VKNQVGLINKKLLADWLGPLMAAAVLGGMWQGQAEAAPALVANVAEPAIQGGFFVRPHDALAWFKEKRIVTPEQFYALDSASRARAFSVGALSDEYAIGLVQDEIHEAIEQGLPASQWLTKLEERFASAGLGNLPQSDVYWRLVYDTNATMALSAGRYIQQMQVRQERPYWLFWNPDPVTPECQAMEGKVFRADDPIWRTHYPPLHFRCKSMVLTLDADEVAAEGLEVQDTSAGHSIPPPAPGFEFNPADAFFLNKGAAGMPATAEGKAAVQLLLGSWS